MTMHDICYLNQHLIIFCSLFLCIFRYSCVYYRCDRQSVHFFKNYNMRKEHGMRRLTVLLVCISAAGLFLPAHATDASDVVPIQWSRFSAGAPQDAFSLLAAEAVNQNIRYALTWFWTLHMQGEDLNKSDWSEQDDRDYIDFLEGTGKSGYGKNPADIRFPAAFAWSMAVALSLNIYDEAVTGVDRDEAKRKCLRLIGSVAKAHRVNATPDAQYGKGWTTLPPFSQSALWATYAGMAGWLMWDELSGADQTNVARMVEYEANRFWDIAVTNDVNRETETDEDQWKAMIYWCAVNMMPGHENWKRWLEHGIALAVTAWTRPSDVNRTDQLNGTAIKDWTEGANVKEDCSLVHKGQDPNINYMENTFTTQAVTYFALAGKKGPEATLFNAENLYYAWVDHEYPEHGNATIMIPGEARLNYLGSSAPADNINSSYGVAWLDNNAHLLGYDNTVSRKGDYWFALHAEPLLQRQRQSSTGAVSQDGGNNAWINEALVGEYGGSLYLIRWLHHNNALHVTDAAIPQTSVDWPQWSSGQVQTRRLSPHGHIDRNRAADDVRVFTVAGKSMTAAPAHVQLLSPGVYLRTAGANAATCIVRSR